MIRPLILIRRLFAAAACGIFSRAKSDGRRELFSSLWKPHFPNLPNLSRLDASLSGELEEAPLGVDGVADEADDRLDPRQLREVLVDDEPEAAGEGHLVGQDADEAGVAGGAEGGEDAQARAGEGGAQLRDEVRAVERGAALRRHLANEVT